MITFLEFMDKMRQAQDLSARHYRKSFVGDPEHVMGTDPMVLRHLTPEDFPTRIHTRSQKLREKIKELEARIKRLEAKLSI